MHLGRLRAPCGLAHAVLSWIRRVHTPTNRRPDPAGHRTMIQRATRRRHRGSLALPFVALVALGAMSGCEGRATSDWTVSYLDQVSPSAAWSGDAGFWLAGKCDGLHRLDGARSELVRLGSNPYLSHAYALAPCSATTAWAVGGFKAAFYDGVNWRTAAEGLGADDSLSGIWCRDDGEAWAYSPRGDVFHHQAGRWNKVASAPTDLLWSVEFKSITGRCNAGGCRIWIAGSGRTLEIVDGILKPLTALDRRQTAVRSYPGPTGDRILFQVDEEVFEIVDDGSFRPWPEPSLPLLLRDDRAYYVTGDGWPAQHEIVEVQAGERHELGLPNSSLDNRWIAQAGLARDGHLWVIGTDQEIGEVAGPISCLPIGIATRTFIAHQSNVP